MMLWDCTHCGWCVTHRARGCDCLPAQRIDEREFKSARIAQEQQRIEQIRLSERTIRSSVSATR